MTQRELERELADVTGESIDTIRGMGFSLIEVPEPEPSTIDWDSVQAEQRVGFLPAHPRQCRRMAA